MVRLVAVFCTLGLLCGLSPTRLPAEENGAAKTLAPFLDSRTVGILTIHLPGIDVDKLASHLNPFFVTSMEQLERDRKAVSHFRQLLLDHGVESVYLVMSLSDMPMQPPFFVFPAGSKEQASQLAQTIQKMKLLPTNMKIKASGTNAIAASEKTQERLPSLEPASFPEISQVLPASKGTPIRYVMVASQETRRIFEEVVPTLPPELGGGSIKLITQGLRYVALSLQVNKDTLSFQLTLQATSPAAAEKLDDLAQRALKVAATDRGVRNIIPGLADLLPKLKPTVEKDQLSLTLREEALLAVLGPALASQQLAVRRQRTNSALKQVGLAMHNYHDTHRQFPASAILGKDGKPLLSWRVNLLPYLGQSELYNQFKLDEPWDSPHNKKLIASMPAVFRPANARLAAAGKTLILVPVGKDTIFPPGEGIKVTDITDGTSTTFLAIEVDESQAVIWTKPDDLSFDPKQPRKGIVKGTSPGITVLFADGSVHFIPAKIDDKNLRRLFLRNDGEPVMIP